MGKLLEQDWRILRSGVEILESYILSPELYWPLTDVSAGPGQAGPLKFTLGNLELSQARLGAVQWGAEDQASLNDLNGQVEALHQRWRANWSRKAAREFPARLKLWQEVLSDFMAERGRRSSGYAFDVRWRVILNLLKADMGEIAVQDAANLASLDTQLKAITQPGPFVWETEVQPAFPMDVYWYLYVTLRTI